MEEGPGRGIWAEKEMVKGQEERGREPLGNLGKSVRAAFRRSALPPSDLAQYYSLLRPDSVADSEKPKLKIPLATIETP